MLRAQWLLDVRAIAIVPGTRVFRIAADFSAALAANGWRR
jgi:hypothetical protein